MLTCWSEFLLCCILISHGCSFGFLSVQMWNCASFLQFIPHQSNKLFLCMRGHPLKKLELSSSGQAPCNTGFPHQVSVLRTHPYWCTSWCCCERLHSCSVELSEDSLNMFAHFNNGLLTSTSAHTALSIQQLLIQNNMTSVPYSPYSPVYSLPPERLYFSFPG